MGTVTTTKVARTGSMVATVRRWQAGDYAHALTTEGHRLPLGWDPAAQRGAAGYDLVLATPRTLSPLAWFLFRERPQATEAIRRAQADATQAVAVEFAVAVGAHAPTLVDHGFDSAGQPWLHTHVVYGALATGDDGFTPVPRVLVGEQARLHVWGYHLLLRQGVNQVIRELDLGWTGPAADGSCELVGLPARTLTAVELPCRPLSEIAACVLE